MLHAPEQTFALPTPPARPLWQSLKRGFRHRCPNCGEGNMFTRFLKVSDSCSACSEELHHHRADDAPPYFTIFVSGHLIIPAMLAVERLWRPDMWIHMALWIPLTIAMCLALLPPIKGALVGLQWALRMHGFEDEPLEARADADPLHGSREAAS